jgi:dipeptide/tripeptide permease
MGGGAVGLLLLFTRFTKYEPLGKWYEKGNEENGKKDIMGFIYHTSIGSLINCVATSLFYDEKYNGYFFLLLIPGVSFGVVYFLILKVANWRAYSSVEMADENWVSVADYSIMVENIPNDIRV